MKADDDEVSIGASLSGSEELLRQLKGYCGCVCGCGIFGITPYVLWMEDAQFSTGEGSMLNAYEEQALKPNNGDMNKIDDKVLRQLYVDLFNLIVESRKPGINERGYGNGYHCPPLLGRSTHLCDLEQPECRKHQKLIHRLLRAVWHNVFEVEVLMLPDCCSDLKLSERIKNKEYVLLERWSMTLSQNDNTQFIEVPELLRAVHSFLHFSQISAWFSSTKGKSPANIYYWVKPTSDSSSTQFESAPQIHSFPLFKVNEELYGNVRVNFPTRKEYIPTLPCSKHPPLQELRSRLSEDSNLAPPIPLNQQIVKQLPKNFDNKQSIIAVKHRATDPEPLKISSTAVLNTVTKNLNDTIKTKRMAKHPNSWLGAKITNEGVSISCDSQMNNRNIISSKAEATSFLNYRQAYSICSSQKNLCFSKSSTTTVLPRKEFKLSSLILQPSLCELNTAPVEVSQLHTSTPNVPKCCSMSTMFRSDMCNVSSEVSSSLSSLEPSQSGVSSYQSNSFHKALKRKYFLRNELQVIPNKRPCLNEENFEREENLNKLSMSCQKKMDGPFKRKDMVQKPFKRKDNHSSMCSENISNQVNCSQENNCSTVEKLGDQNVYESSRLNVACISSERKAMNEESKEMPENNSNQTSNDSFNSKSSNEKNLNLTDTCVKLKLVNFPEETLCTNQNVSKKVDLNFCSSFDCDNLVDTELNYEASNSISKETLNDCCPFNYSNKTREMLIQHYKTCLNINCLMKIEKLLLNTKLFSKYYDLLNSLQNISAEDLGKSFSVHSRHQSLSKPYKPRRLKKFDTYQSTAVPSSNDEQEKILELIKSPSLNSETISEHFPHSNVSPKVQKGVLHKICKKKTWKRKFLLNLRHKICKRKLRRKILSKLKDRIKLDANSNLVGLTQESEETHYQNKIINSAGQKQIIVENSDNEKSNSDSSSNSDCCKCGQKHEEDHSFNLVLLSECAAVESRASFDASNNFVNSDQESSKRVVTFLKQDTSLLLKKETAFSPSKFCNVLPQKATPYLDCFPRHTLKFARGRKLLGNFEESILSGCLPPLSIVDGFSTEIGASGSFCPNHITLPAKVTFYDMDNLNYGTPPYMAHVRLGDVEYYVPKKGAVQVTLFNPSHTVVKMLVLNYDLSDMPPLCHTFIRQKTYYMPVGSTEDCPSSTKWLRFIFHLRFASSKTGKLYLHKDFKIVVLNKSNDDAASEFNQEPRELRSFLHVPMNPTFSNF